jgi:hypothetical protein
MSSILNTYYLLIIKILLGTVLVTSLLSWYYRVTIVTKSNKITELETSVIVKDKIYKTKIIERKLEGINLTEKGRLDDKINYDIGTHSITIK